MRMRLALRPDYASITPWLEHTPDGVSATAGPDGFRLSTPVAVDIEDGAVTHALTETMVSGNLQDLLMQITAVSRDRVNFGNGRFPYLAAGGVTISSKD